MLLRNNTHVTLPFQNVGQRQGLASLGVIADKLNTNNMTDMTALNDDAQLQQVKRLVAVYRVLYVHKGARFLTVWPTSKVTAARRH